MTKKVNKVQTKKYDQDNEVIKILSVFILGLLVPILLVPMAKTIGRTEILEEAAKALLVLFLVLSFDGFWKKILVAISLGFLFGISENFLYLYGIMQAGKTNAFEQRMLLSLPLHILTFVIITLSAVRKKWLIIMGVSIAIILHIIFNLFVVA
ncbi:MAG: PrsW family glutamic-type intramembrane protease [Candidatus Moranbacteria bacterium]|nr:PrsW family glutamic-type intramembrane protease [Candidatus Moranbacteria bacterium]